MRTFELLVVIALLAYFLWLSFGSGLPASAFRLLPFVTAGLVLLQIWIEGVRWQLGPLYLLVLLSVALYPWWRARSFRIRLRLVAAGWGVVFVLLGATLITGGVLWPVFRFAALTGPYPVGTVSAHLIDHGRRDPYAPSKSRYRELMVEIWYPAETARAFRRAQYRDGRRSDYRDSSLALVNTRSFLEAPIATRQPKYPVLLFTGPENRFQNTFETEELASQGFIVVAIDHPYDSDLVVFPDGRRVFRRPEAGYLDVTSNEALARSRVMVERRLAVRVADTVYVLGELEQWNASEGNRFFSRLDMSRIGMIGHSFGGAVTAEVCRIDPRVRAGLNMDGTLFGTAKREGVPKPYLVMFDPTPRPTKADLESPNAITRRESRETQGDYEDVDRTLGRYGGYFLQVPGLEHMNFSDYALYSQLKAWTGAGTIRVRRAHEMLNRVTLAFFRRELLDDRSASVEAVLRDYPEATLRRQSPPSRQCR